MHDVGSPSAQQHAVRLRERMAGEDGVRQRFQGHIDRQHANGLSLVVVQWLTKRCHHLLHDDAVGIRFRERFYPVFLVQLTGNQIPVHAEVLVAVVALLLRHDAVAAIIGIGREILAFFLEEVWLERYAAALQHRVLLQNLLAQVEHGVCTVQLVFYQRYIGIGCSLNVIDHHERLSDSRLQRLDSGVHRAALHVGVTLIQRYAEAHRQQQPHGSKQPFVFLHQLLHSTFLIPHSTFPPPLCMSLGA